MTDRKGWGGRWLVGAANTVRNWTETDGDIRLSPIARLHLLLLASYANEWGDNIFPSQARLAEEAGCDERTTRRALKELERLKLISRERRNDRAGRTSDLIFLQIDLPPGGWAYDGTWDSTIECLLGGRRR